MAGHVPAIAFGTRQREGSDASTKKPRKAASISPASGARSKARMRSSSSASASISAHRPRISCSRASCWSGIDSRYVVTQRETFYQSDILLTPYNDKEEIDADKLGAFIDQQYKDANVEPERDRHRRADPHRRRRAPPQRAQDRRAVRRSGRQARRGQRRRQPGDRDGGLRLRRRGAFHPRQLAR